MPFFISFSAALSDIAEITPFSLFHYAAIDYAFIDTGLRHYAAISLSPLMSFRFRHAAFRIFSAIFIFVFRFFTFAAPVMALLPFYFRDVFCRCRCHAIFAADVFSRLYAFAPAVSAGSAVAGMEAYEAC